MNSKTGDILNSIYDGQFLESPHSSIESSDINVKVITEEADLCDLQNDWDELVESCNATIFQTFEWLSTWWKYFGGGKELYVITFNDHHHVIGVFPFFKDSFTFWGWELYSCLRFLGSTVIHPEGEELKGFLPYSDYLDVIIRPGYEHLVFTSFLDHLQKSGLDYDQLILDEVPEHSLIHDYLLPLLEKRGISYNVAEASGCASIQLEPCWEQYLMNLSKSSRYKVRKFLKKAHHPEHKIFEIEQVQSTDKYLTAFKQLERLHQERWHAAGYPGTFAEKRFAKFLKEIVSLCLRKGWAELYLATSIKEENKYVAADLIFTFNHTFYLSQRAFDIHSKMSDHGVGNVLLLQEVKDAICRGYEALDFMRGEESYKFRYANTRRQNKIITVDGNRRYRGWNVHLVRQITFLKRRLIFEKDSLGVLLNTKGVVRGMYHYSKRLLKRLGAKLWIGFSMLFE